jgi:hypothetical protein
MRLQDAGSLALVAPCVHTLRMSAWQLLGAVVELW